LLRARERGVAQLALGERQEIRQFGFAPPGAALEHFEELQHPLTTPLTAEERGAGKWIGCWGLHGVRVDGTRCAKAEEFLMDAR
jgi:hypothetical protein